jgi:phage terminase large subunit GpA-like protein
VGVDHAKESIYDRLRIEDPGPGYCHFPLGRDLEYFEELTAEKKYTSYRHGFPRREWRKDPGARNEALDCRVLAYAALHSLYFAGFKLNAESDRMSILVQEAPLKQKENLQQKKDPIIERPNSSYFGNRTQNWFNR